MMFPANETFREFSATFTDRAGVSWWTAGLRVSLPFGW